MIMKFGFRKLKNIALLAFLLFSIVPSFAANLTVAVSLQPYGNILKSIGGDRVDVVTMLPPGADPHTFEPKPASLKEFAKATVYFSDGSGMDKAWLPRFQGVNKNVQVVDISQGIQWLDEDAHHHESDHGEANHHHGELDPHVWTSPERVSIIVKNVVNALVSLDPAGKESYVANAQKLLNKISALDIRLQIAVADLPKEKRTFIVFHPSYGYLAEDYGMKQLSIEVNGKEPKPRDLQRLVSEGKSSQVHIVFIQPQFSKRAAATIAKELNAVVQETDPLAFDFLGNTEKLIDAITAAASK